MLFRFTIRPDDAKKGLDPTAFVLPFPDLADAVLFSREVLAAYMFHAGSPPAIPLTIGVSPVAFRRDRSPSAGRLHVVPSP